MTNAQENKHEVIEVEIITIDEEEARQLELITPFSQIPVASPFNNMSEVLNNIVANEYTEQANEIRALRSDLIQVFGERNSLQEQLERIRIENNDLKAEQTKAAEANKYLALQIDAERRNTEDYRAQMVLLGSQLREKTTEADMKKGVIEELQDKLDMKEDTLRSLLWAVQSLSMSMQYELD